MKKHWITRSTVIITALAALLTGCLPPTGPESELPQSFTTGRVASEQGIGQGMGGFTGTLTDNDFFGFAITSLGDVNGDGVTDLAAGTFGDDDGGTDRGAAWILFLNTDGTVANHQKISDTEGGFTGILDDGDTFGISVAGPGDINKDGVPDLIVGADSDDDTPLTGGEENMGAVWVLFLNADGTVSSHQKISSTEGGLAELADRTYFGWSVEAIGDLDGDGTPEIAVGGYGDDDGGTDRGAVWILFLNTDGTVKSETKISDIAGSFGGVLADNVQFGSDIAALGDLDQDGVDDIAVASWRDNDGGSRRGAVWVLFLEADGTVKAEQKISDTAGSFSGTIDDDQRFGTGVAGPGDLNGDGTPDLVVGGIGDDGGGIWRGAAWVLFLNTNGTVASHQKISDNAGGFGGTLVDYESFGSSVAAPGDLNEDGIPDLVVSSSGWDGGTNGNGTAWVLFLEAGE